jgi:hypothetical protein
MTSVMPVSDPILDPNSYELALLQCWGPIRRHCAGRIAEQVTEPLRAHIENDFCSHFLSSSAIAAPSRCSACPWD